MISFFVPGTPAPGGSKRFKGHFQRHTAAGKIARIPLLVDDCARNGSWRQTVQVFAVQAYKGPPLTAPLAISATFILTRPRCHYGTGKNAHKLKASAPKHPTTKPDATKLFRSTEDALTGILWRDDAQIILQNIKKEYGDTPGVKIWVTEMGDDA